MSMRSVSLRFICVYVLPPLPVRHVRHCGPSTCQAYTFRGLLGLAVLQRAPLYLFIPPMLPLDLVKLKVGRMSGGLTSFAILEFPSILRALSFVEIVPRG